VIKNKALTRTASQFTKSHVTLLQSSGSQPAVHRHILGVHDDFLYECKIAKYQNTRRCGLVYKRRFRLLCNNLNLLRD